ncbi:hypothetical protein GCM10027447_21880 [Glycomyces halotolerans]
MTESRSGTGAPVSVAARTGSGSAGGYASGAVNVPVCGSAMDLICHTSPAEAASVTMAAKTAKTRTSVRCLRSALDVEGASSGGPCGAVLVASGSSLSLRAMHRD